MILMELKGYLDARGQATLADMALHFRSEPEALRDMLGVWERKGRVRRVPAPAGCGGSCTPTILNAGRRSGKSGAETGAIEGGDRDGDDIGDASAGWGIRRATD